MVNFVKKSPYEWDDLARIVALLRSPEGCPWDREQTHRSIRDNLLEECCEALEALDTGASVSLCEELGDVLLQVFLHAQIAAEADEFTLGSVVDGIARKLIFRHPHVFSDVQAESVDEVLRNWDDIKRAAKGQALPSDAMRGVSRGLPGLMRAEKLLARAERAGGSEDAAAPVSEEELGEALFSLAVRARRGGLSAEKALHAACDRFIEKFADSEASGAPG